VTPLAGFPNPMPHPHPLGDLLGRCLYCGEPVRERHAHLTEEHQNIKAYAHLYCVRESLQEETS